MFHNYFCVNKKISAYNKIMRLVFILKMKLLYIINFIMLYIIASFYIRVAYLQDILGTCASDI